MELFLLSINWFYITFNFFHTSLRILFPEVTVEKKQFCIKNLVPLIEEQKGCKKCAI